MKRIVKLNERDLSRIVRRVINEGMDIPPCRPNDLSVFMNVLKDVNNNLPIKVETDGKYSEILIITQPDGKQCGCNKSEFFV
jgi:hypothetical protein